MPSELEDLAGGVFPRLVQHVVLGVPFDADHPGNEIDNNFKDLYPSRGPNISCTRF